MLHSLRDCAPLVNGTTTVGQQEGGRAADKLSRSRAEVEGKQSEYLCLGPQTLLTEPNCGRTVDMNPIAADRAAALVHQRRRLPPPSRCRALRRAVGLTTRDVAQMVGCTAQSVSNWETGKRVPYGRRLTAYLDALDFMKGLS